MKWQITLIKPPGENRTEALREVAETLLYGLRRIGESAELNVNTIRPGSRHIILGADLLLEKQVDLLPSDSIIYNLEQLPFSPVSESYFWLGKKFHVWDYSELNVAEWAKRGVAAKLVPIGYVPELNRIKPAEKDTDVFFYGSMNSRRRKVLDDLTAAGLSVRHAFGLYGERRDRWIARSRVVLNIHYYDSKVFEIVRVSYLMANGVAVVAEDSDDLPEKLCYSLTVSTYDSLVGSCIDLVTHSGVREEMEMLGANWFQQIREEEILQRAIA